MTTTNPLNFYNSTVVRTALRGLVSAVASTLIAWATVKIGSFHGSVFAEISLIGTPVYFGAVLWLETKFPSLGWLLGLLPQPKSNPAPAPTPAPTPAPVPAPTPAPVVVTPPAVGSKAAKTQAVKKSGSRALK